MFVALIIFVSLALTVYTVLVIKLFYLYFQGQSLLGLSYPTFILPTVK